MPSKSDKRLLKAVMDLEHELMLLRWVLEDSIRKKNYEKKHKKIQAKTGAA